MFLRTLVRQSTSDDSLLAYQGLNQGTTHSPLALSLTSRSILRSLTSALEELELNLHNTTLKADHAHMYLYILREQEIADLLPYHKSVTCLSSCFAIEEKSRQMAHFMTFCRKTDLNNEHKEAEVQKILEDLAHEINASVGVRMHKLGVCEWEVKLWVSSAGDATGAWRILVENVTGHTCIVHVS